MRFAIGIPTKSFRLRRGMAPAGRGCCWRGSRSDASESDGARAARVDSWKSWNFLMPLDFPNLFVGLLLGFELGK